MNIFSEVKEHLTARQVAEYYGLQVKRNGLACCPFHDDKHPSMKIDKNYHCFACGVGGDAVDYASRMFGLSQYDAALRLIEDFMLSIDAKGIAELSVQEKERIRREKAERERITRIQERFDKWCSQTVDLLRNCISEIDSVNRFLIGKPPDIIFSEDYARMLYAEPLINYWLDILCMGDVSERQELFLNDRKKVEEIAGKVCTSRKRIMGCSREALDMEMSTVEDVLESLARTQKGNVKSSIENCMTILYRDPLLKGAICKNELTNKIDIVKPLLWKRNGNSITDVDMYQIQRYIETNYGISNDKVINKAVSIAASERSYHPIRNFLEALQWDGKSRIASLLPRFLGADDNEYTREIIRLLMLAAVHRVYEPGCKFEIMVCLVGGQGAGKSTFFRFLAVNDEWFTDDLKRMDDENVYSKMQGHWIIEMSEMLATVNAKSIEDIKSFLSRQKETYRIPYQTYAEDRPRQCIFVGTSNNLDFLPLDRTGNRRFAPVLVHQDRVEKHILEDEKESREYIVQAWAEAMVIYKNCLHELKLSKEMEEYLKEMQKQFMPEDTKVGVIQAWLDDCTDEYVCSEMIYREALRHEYEEPKRWEINEINDIMNTCIEGWEKVNSHRFDKGYGRQRGWRRKSDRQGFSSISKDVQTPFEK